MADLHNETARFAVKRNAHDWGIFWHINGGALVSQNFWQRYRQVQGFQVFFFFFLYDVG
jgi:hypothetical protein